MARKTSRRGGAWYDPRSWFKPSCESARKKTADAKAKEDEACAGEASATSLPTETPVTAPEPASAPAAPSAFGGRTRRRRATRRKSYKGGKHRKGH